MDNGYKGAAFSMTEIILSDTICTISTTSAVAVANTIDIATVFLLLLFWDGQCGEKLTLIVFHQLIMQIIFVLHLSGVAPSFNLFLVPNPTLSPMNFCYYFFALFIFHFSKVSSFTLSLSLSPSALQVYSNFFHSHYTYAYAAVHIFTFVIAKS